MKNDKQQLNLKPTPTAQAAADTISPNLGLNRAQRRALGLDGDTKEEQELNALDLFKPEPNNGMWDEIMGKAIACHALLAAPGAVLPMLRNEQLMAIVQQQGNSAAVNAVTNTLTRDMNKFSQQFQKIFDTHKDKKGATHTGSEHWEALNVFNAYIEFTEDFNSNVMPVFEHLSELLAPAEKALTQVNPDNASQLATDVSNKLHHLTGRVLEETLAEEQGLSPEQDPNVITDIQPNEKKD